MFTDLRRMTWKVSLLTTIISLLAFTVALAASGDLDTSFSGDGRVTTNFGLSPGRQDYIEAIAIQSNGKIVAAGFSNGDFALTRYNTNGSLDTTFSGDGRLITNFSGDDRAYDVAVQSDGKIVAAGRKCSSSICDVALARYNIDSTLDTTFSGDGKQTTDVGGNTNGALGLAIQKDGKIVLAGHIFNGTDSDFAIYRYNTDGSLDTTFSVDGIAIGNFGLNLQDVATDLVIQSDGKIVLVGYTGDLNGQNNNFAVARLNKDGTADLTFSGDGRQTTNFSADDYAYGVALQPNGKIVVVGQKLALTNSLSSFAIARYNTNGSLDTTFNSTGKKSFSISGSDSWAFDVVVQSDFTGNVKNIMVAGQTDNGSGVFDFALVSLNLDGGFDTTFSGDGKVTVDFGGNDVGSALALQLLDGKYMLGGYTDFGTGGIDLALARVLP